MQNGDNLAFTAIYNRYWDKLYYIAYKLLKDTDAAEEIVQDVFLMLWQKKRDLNYTIAYPLPGRYDALRRVPVCCQRKKQ